MPRYDDADGDLTQGLPPYEEYDEEAEEEDPDPELDDLPADVRDKVQALITKRTNDFKGAYGSRVAGVVDEIRRMGLDVTAEGVTVRNPALLAPFVAPHLQGGQAGGPAGKQTEDDPAAEPEVMPDPYTEPDKFRAWIESLAEKKAAGYQTELRELRQTLGAQSMHTVLTTAADVLPEVGLGDLLEMDGFQAALEDGFRKLNIPEREWGDPDMIARVAGVVNVDLRKAAKAKAAAGDPFDLLAARRPPARPQNQRQGEEKPAAGARQALNNLGRTQIGASGGRENPGRTASYDDKTVQQARRLGIHPREVAALRDDSGSDYRKLQADQARRNKR